MASYECILVDAPLPTVRRVTLNRPQKRNALNNRLRTEILQALEDADRDPDVRVSICLLYTSDAADEEIV